MPSLVETLTWLIDIPSVTGSESEICDAVSARLAGLPQQRVGDSLVVGEPTGRQLVVLAGHLDTVPSQGQGPARVEGGKVHGLGSADMKAGLAVMIHLLSDPAVTRGDHDVVGVFYAGEEGPSSGNQLENVLVAHPWLTVDAVAIVLEPSDGEIQYGCNGVVNAVVSFAGKAAHSARPWWGENAITKAGTWLERMHRLEPRSHHVAGLEFRRTVVVTGAAGGVAQNIVPPAFEVTVNMRFPPDMTVERAVDELARLCADADSFRVVDSAPAGEVAVDHPLIGRLAAVSGAPRAAKQGWTDVARFSAHGVPAVNFGPGSAAQAHQVDEWVEVESLYATHAALRLLLAGEAG